MLIRKKELQLNWQYLNKMISKNSNQIILTKLPKFCTVAETKKHRDDEQIDVIQIPKKKMKNFSADL